MLIQSSGCNYNATVGRSRCGIVKRYDVGSVFS